MIKPVSVMNSVVKTPAVRNIATATMLTLGVLGVGACAGGNSNKTADNAQTEIVSVEGAEALKAAAIPNQPIYSNEPNKKMVDALTKLELGGVLKHYNNLCKSQGTFLATAYAQNSIDYLMMLNRNENTLMREIKETYGLNANTREDLKSIRGFIFDNINDFYDYIDTLKTGYVQDFTYAIKGKKSAQEVSLALDELIATQKNLSAKDKKKYAKSVEFFKKSQPDEIRNSLQGWTDLIAFKIYKIDELVYKKGISEIKSLTSSKYYNENFLQGATETSIGY